MLDQDLWHEVGATMRRLRVANGESLRQVETVGPWRRGSLSQVENGKARPSRSLVEFYDRRYAGDGLLLSLFAEAHTISPAVDPVPQDGIGRLTAGDAMRLARTDLPAGGLVNAGERLSVSWTLMNVGAVPWCGRALRRVGATAGVRLLSSSPTVPVPDTPVGHSVRVGATVTAPEWPGTVTAHWRMVTADGLFCFPVRHLLAVTLVVR